MPPNEVVVDSPETFDNEVEGQSQDAYADDQHNE
jgi:hypothetical protein